MRDRMGNFTPLSRFSALLLMFLPSKTERYLVALYYPLSADVWFIDRLTENGTMDVFFPCNLMRFAIHSRYEPELRYFE